MAIQKSTDSSSLAEVIDRILDKGIVIDAYARISVVGIELITIEARVVIASVDTWLRYAEAVGLLRDEVEEEGLGGRLSDQEYSRPSQQSQQNERAQFNI
ncbi:gas vesicle structural protein GvpA [Halobacillus sp. Marseille-Q1614]|uniref:gas vesicle structural protein GvpA n=1 Tax=Halobacillus sp. Marseille-Q1614 TaxID=2709134 RepID=UPI001570E581|nr:gas vesicle structural protein GvpA [Halobacillus sp. Marseille-Q1614]